MENVSRLDPHTTALSFFSKTPRKVRHILMGSFSGLNVVKLVASGIVGIGTGKIVRGVIKSHIEAPEKLFDRITIVAATSVISSIVARETKKYTDETIDSVAKFVSGLMDSAEEADEVIKNVSDLVVDKQPAETATVIDSDPVTTTN